MAFWPALTILGHAWLFAATYVWAMAPPHPSNLWASKNYSLPFLQGTLNRGDGIPPKARAHVPKYMLELYETMKSSHHLDDSSANIVRSYGNINDDMFKAQDNLFNEKEENLISHTRIHSLVFNVTSLPEQENLQKANLRLYALIHRDQRTYAGVEREVTISECSGIEGDESGCQIIAFRHVYETANAWETFNVTPAVKLWLDQSQRRREQRLKVHIKSVISSKHSDDFDFPTEPFSDTEPLLLVYSSDRGRSRPVDTHSLARRSTGMEDAEEESNMIMETEYSSKSTPAKFANNRRKLKNPCRRRPLYVNFSDINYDSWIIAPDGYQAYDCAGKCYFPMSDHLSPTKHAIIQTLLHTVSPKKASRACCVPTKLSPISILYLDDNNIVTYKFHFDDMVVAECGCR